MASLQMETTMRNRKCETKSGEESGHEDHFLRLPDDLVISVFDKVAELKSLFMCSLVSKNFSSLVPHVKAVSMLASIPINPGMELFLQKFTEVESISVEFQYSGSGDSSPLAMWKVKFGTRFPNVEMFVAVSAASVHEPNHEQISQQNDSEFPLSQFRNCFRAYLVCYHRWMHIVSGFCKSHTSLKRVTIADSEKRGKLVIGDEQLVMLRSCALDPLDTETVVKACDSFASAPVLQLPLSGYVMKEAALMIINHLTEASASTIKEIVSWNFEDDEKVLGEAIREFYKNHSIVKMNS